MKKDTIVKKVEEKGVKGVPIKERRKREKKKKKKKAKEKGEKRGKRGPYNSKIFLKDKEKETVKK